MHNLLNPSELWPLSVTCLGLVAGSDPAILVNAPAPVGIYEAFPITGTNATQYFQAGLLLDEDSQVSALAQFGEQMFANSVSLPKAAADLLTERFWDLI